MPSREEIPDRPCVPARAKDWLWQAGLLTPGSLLGLAFPDGDPVAYQGFARRLQLRVQRRIFTGFPFHLARARTCHALAHRLTGLADQVVA